MLNWCLLKQGVYFTSASAIDAYRQTQRAVKICSTSRPRPLSNATFPSLTARLSTQGIENDVSAGLSNIRFRLLWPWPTDARGQPSIPFCPGVDLCEFALKSVHSVSKYSVHKLVIDQRTDRRTDGHVDQCIYWHTVKYSNVRCRYCVCVLLSPWAHSVRDS